MDRNKLEIIREELVKFIVNNDFGENISSLEKLEAMRNVNKFLDPDNYEENIRTLNENRKNK